MSEQSDIRNRPDVQQAMAVNSVDDATRSSMENPDETTSVVSAGGELRTVEDAAGEDAESDGEDGGVGEDGGDGVGPGTGHS